MKEKLSFIFKLFILIMCGIGLYLNFKIFSLNESLVYFTIQSNLLCFIFYLIVIVLTLMKKLKKNNIYYIVKGTSTMTITITMFVYQILLSSSDGMGAYINHELECNFVHLYVPLLIIFDYIIFGEKGNLKKHYPFIWSIILIAYLIFDIVYVSLGGTFANGNNYPYFYMNVEELGLFKVMINCLCIYIFFVGYGYIVQWLDNKVAKLKNLDSTI